MKLATPAAVRPLFATRNCLRALAVCAVLLTVVAVMPAFAENGAQFTTRQGSLVRVTSFAGAANAGALVAPDFLEFRRDASAEIIRREMVDELAAERARSPLGLAVAAAAPVVTLPAVDGLPIDEDRFHGLGFVGITNLTQSTGGNAPFSVEPPDQGLCTGGGFVLEAVNDALAVYSSTGAPLTPVVPLNAFFGQLPESNPAALNLSDPRCLFDSGSHRWFLSVVAYPGDLSTSAIMVAVSTSPDPTGSFAIYSFDVTNDGRDFLANDCPCLGDQPLIGVNADGFYFSTNAFGQKSFEGAQLYAVPKKALVMLSSTVPVLHIDGLSNLLPDIEFAISIQPSFSPPGDPGDSGTEYFVQAFRARRLEQRITVWALGNTSALNSDPTKVTVRFSVLPSQVYARPVSAYQKAGPTPRAVRTARGDFTGSRSGPANEQNLDGNDDRMQQVMFSGGHLWTALGTALTTPANAAPTSPVLDGAAWFVISVHNPPSGLLASISDQGYVAAADNSHVTYPALGVNAHGRAAMVFTVTSQHLFPSAAYWSFGGSQIHILGQGTEPEDGFAAYQFNRPRWGDYSAAAVASDGSIWVATEMIPGGARRDAANWGTFVARIHAGEGD
jgi:hypothetical protein